MQAPPDDPNATPLERAFKKMSWSVMAFPTTGVAYQILVKEFEGDFHMNWETIARENGFRNGLQALLSDERFVVEGNRIRSAEYNDEISKVIDNPKRSVGSSPRSDNFCHERSNTNRSPAETRSSGMPLSNRQVPLGAARAQLLKDLRLNGSIQHQSSQPSQNSDAKFAPNQRGGSGGAYRVDDCRNQPDFSKRDCHGFDDTLREADGSEFVCREENQRPPQRGGYRGGRGYATVQNTSDQPQQSNRDLPGKHFEGPKRGAEYNQRLQARRVANYDEIDANAEAEELENFGFQRDENPQRGGYNNSSRGQSFHDRRFNQSQPKPADRETTRFSDFRDRFVEERGNNDEDRRPASRCSSRGSAHSFSQRGGGFQSGKERVNDRRSAGDRRERRSTDKYEGPPLADSMAANFPNRLMRNNAPTLRESESMGADFPNRLVNNSYWSMETCADAHESLVTENDNPERLERPKFVRNARPSRNPEDTLNLSDPVVVAGCVPPASVPQNGVNNSRASNSSGAFRGGMKMLSKAFATCNLGGRSSRMETSSRDSSTLVAKAPEREQRSPPSLTEPAPNAEKTVASNADYAEQSTVVASLLFGDLKNDASTATEAVTVPEEEKSNDDLWSQIPTVTESIMGPYLSL